MPFLPPNQQRQSNEGTSPGKRAVKRVFLSDVIQTSQELATFEIWVK